MSRLRRLVVSDGWFFITYPVKAVWAKRSEDWPGSSIHDYTGNRTDAPETPSGLSVDRVLLPADPRTRIGRRTAE